MLKKIFLLIFIFITYSLANNSVNYIYKDTVKNLVSDLSLKHYFIEIKEEIFKQNQDFLFYINKLGNLNFKGKYKYQIEDNKIGYILPFFKNKDLKNFVRNSNYYWDKNKGILYYIPTKKELFYIKLLDYINNKNYYINSNEPLNKNIIWFYPLGNYTIAQKLYKNNKWYINKILVPEIEKNTIILSNPQDLNKLPKLISLKVYIKTDNGLVLYMFSNGKWKPFTESGTQIKKIIDSFYTFITTNFDYSGGSQVNVKSPFNEWTGYRTFIKYDSKEGGWWEDKISKKYIVFKDYNEFVKLRNRYGNNTIYYFYDKNIKSIIKFKKINNKFYLIERDLKDLKKYLGSIYLNYNIFTDNYYVIFKNVNQSFIVYNKSKTQLLYNLKFGNRNNYRFISGINYNNTYIIFDNNDCSKNTCNGNNSDNKFYKGNMIDNYFFKFKKYTGHSYKKLNNLTDYFN